MLTDINKVWVQLLTDVHDRGELCTPRGKQTRELVGHKTVVDMNKPVLTLADRKLSYKFMTGEAWWILSGDDRVETIAPYNIRISQYSDDSQVFYGAYGPRVSSQIEYVVHNLIDDQSSRQATMTIWRQNPPYSKDVPCTIAAQWLIRNGTLHCIDYMRSSDIWLGWPYDIFNFSMLSAFIQLRLRNFGIHIQLGTITLIAGSQHLYEEHWGDARLIINGTKTRLEHRFDYLSYSPQYFTTSKALVDHLKLLADKDWDNLKCTWLSELSLLSTKK